MNPLTLPQTVAHAIGWTLLHFLWQGALIALVLACVLALLRGRSPQPRYLAACTALLLMVMLPIVTFVRIVTAPRVAVPGTTISLNAFPSNNGYGADAFHQPLLQRIAESIKLVDRANPIILALWFAGALVLLTRLTLGLILARRMKSTATQPPPPELLITFQRIAQRIGLSRPVRLLHSAVVQVPTVIGWLRPVVLIPIGCLSGLSPLQLEAVFAHELAHIRRHDYLISVIQSVAEALLFYHPAIWWVSKTIRAEREHCCDDLAVRIGGDALTYARALSHLAERSLAQSLAQPNIALAATGGNLTMRIRRLLGSNQNQTPAPFAALTLTAVVLATAALGISSAARAQSGQARPTVAEIRIPAATAQQPTANRTLSIEYQNWIDQDVHWDITPPERAAFLQLTTDEERDHFIEQFWLRHDPAGTPRFTFRTEHYRRIAYANQHFAAGTPGWLTDRGHIYIIYGQPSTIDSHPIASGESRPYETWRYAALPGLGSNIDLKFVDICDCGNYHLQSPLIAPHSSAAPTSSLTTSTPTIAPLIKPAASAKPRLHPASYIAVTAPSQPEPVQQQPVQPQQPEQPAAPKPIRVSAGVVAGQIITHINPVYPEFAKAGHIQGAVVLKAVISKEGTVENLTVISGPLELRSSSLEAVRQWIYKPYLLNGQPTEVETTITVNYNLAPPAPSANENSNEDQPLSGAAPEKLGPGITPPAVVTTVPPQYTPQGRQDKISGNVLLKLVVDTNGNPTNVRVVRSLDPGLDQEALKAVKQYKFKPAIRHGKPVATEVSIEVNFRIF